MVKLRNTPAEIESDTSAYKCANLGGRPESEAQSQARTWMQTFHGGPATAAGP